MADSQTTTTPEPDETTAPTLGGVHLTRRRLFAAAPALGLAAAPALASVEPEDDPILPHHRAWLRARRDWWDALRASERAGARGPESSEQKEAEARELAEMQVMADLAPRSMAGVAALAEVLWCYLGPDNLPGTEWWEKDMRAWDCRMILSLWQGASGRAGFPDRLDTAEV